MTATVELTEHQSAALDSYYAELQRSYGEARPESRSAYQRATDFLPGGNSRSQLYFPPFPFFVDRASGSRLHDLDGFEYIDLVNNYTSLVHGHAAPELVEATSAAAARGTAVGTPTRLEAELASELCARVASVEQVRFANSGTEACYFAIRAARAFTGRDGLIKIEGGYDGGVDAVQVSVKHLGAEVGDPVPEPGVPRFVADATPVIPFNDTARAVETIERVGRDCAALIVEPMLGSAGLIPGDPEFLAALRDATREAGCLLIFDEVMSLRLGYGGLQESLGIAPDLTAMGKIVGGGLPIGAFGGRADVMGVMDPRRPDAMQHSGTFNANPVTLAAGLAALRRLTRAEVERINAIGDRIRAHIDHEAAEAGVPVVASGIGSLVQFHWGTSPPRSIREAIGRPKVGIDCLFHALLERGVFVAPRRGLMAISTAIGDAETERIEAAISSSFEEIAGALRPE